MAITATETVLMNEGIYPATLRAWEETPDTGFGIGVKLIWNLDGMTDNDGKQMDKWQYLSQKLTPRSNLWKFLKASGQNPVLGQSYEVDELLDPIVGRSANLVIKHEDGTNGPKAKVTDALFNAAKPAATPDVCGICGKPPGDEEMQYTAAGVFIHARHAD